MSFYLTGLLVLLPIFIILGVSFNLLLGYGGLLSVSHAGFFGVGAYATALLTKEHGLEFVPAVVIGAALAAVCSIPVGWAAGRLADEFLFIATIALQTLIVELLNNLRVTGRSYGLPGIPRPVIFGYEFETAMSLAVLSWAVCTVLVLIGYRSVRSPFGRVLEALREDVPAARSLGKRALRTKVSVFAFSAAMAAVAGGLFAVYLRFISPVEFTIDRSVQILSIAIIGGLGVYWGPYVGALFVVTLPQVLTFFDISPSVAGPVNGIIYSLVVLLILMFRPQGLLGTSASGFMRRQVPLDSSASPSVGLSDSHETSPSATVPDIVEPAGSQRTLQVLKELRDRSGRSVDEVRTLRCDHLTKRFGGLTAVDDVSLEILPGRITGLVGPNGAGKTTVFNLLSGALTPDAGQVTFGGTDITGLSLEQRANLGVVRSFQEVRLFGGMNVIDNVRVGITTPRDESLFAQYRPSSFRPSIEHGREQTAIELLEYLGLEDQLEVIADDLSYAEQKLLMIGRLLATGADCYLLDEPMSGLDPSARERVSALLTDMVASGATICLVEHSMQVIRSVCSWVAFLDEGKLLTEGEPDELMADRTLATIYFGH
jgi:branched-chain amino acid transport system permease protein